MGVRFAPSQELPDGMKIGSPRVLIANLAGEKLVPCKAGGRTCSNDDGWRGWQSQALRFGNDY
jgi:hypothetical protein